MNFEQFVKSKMRNAWIYEPGIKLYVRVSLPSRGTDYDLAAMLATLRGRGALTRFLDTWEPTHSFYIENVLRPERLGKYFLGRGYREVFNYTGARCCCYSNGKTVE